MNEKKVRINLLAITLAPAQPYTDDTAMSICVANVLIEHGAIDQKKLAVRFVKEYFTDPRRGYGGAVINVFGKLRKSKFADLLLPAKEQFGGMHNIDLSGCFINFNVKFV